MTDFTKVDADFEAYFLDGESISDCGGTMISAKEVLEYHKAKLEEAVREERERIIEILLEDLPDCSGCTYDQDEGTHQGMSKQHFIKIYGWKIPPLTKGERE